MNINDGGSTPIAQYAYDAANNVLTRGYRNGTVATSTYNANNWVCSLNHTSGANLIVGFTYAYDNEGNKFYEQKLHETQRLRGIHLRSGLPADRLPGRHAGRFATTELPTSLGVSMPVTQTAYNLDKLGNWNSKDTDGGHPDPHPQPIQRDHTINGRLVVSDFNGNTTTDGTNLYSYDEENRLIKVACEGDQYFWGSTSTTPLAGEYRRSTTSAVQTLYYYDGWRTIEEQSSAGVTQATYVFGNYLDEVLTMDRGGPTYYYHQNALWSIFALSDSTGNGRRRLLLRRLRLSDSGSARPGWDPGL